MTLNFCIYFNSNLLHLLKTYSFLLFYKHIKWWITLSSEQINAFFLLFCDIFEILYILYFNRAHRTNTFVSSDGRFYKVRLWEEKLPSIFDKKEEGSDTQQVRRQQGKIHGHVPDVISTDIGTKKNLLFGISNGPIFLFYLTHIY